MRESGQLYGEPTERTAVGPPQALRGFVRSVGEDCPSGPFVLSSRVGGPGEESGAVLVLLLRSARSTRSALGAPVGGSGFGAAVHATAGVGAAQNATATAAAREGSGHSGGDEQCDVYAGGGWRRRRCATGADMRVRVFNRSAALHAAGAEEHHEGKWRGQRKALQ